MEYMEPDYMDEYYESMRNNKTCNRCGEEYLYWDQDEDGKWRLFNESHELHICSPKSTLDPLDFDVDALNLD